MIWDGNIRYCPEGRTSMMNMYEEQGGKLSKYIYGSSGDWQAKGMLRTHRKRRRRSCATEDPGPVGRSARCCRGKVEGRRLAESLRNQATLRGRRERRGRGGKWKGPLALFISTERVKTAGAGIEGFEIWMRYDASIFGRILKIRM